MTQRPQQPSMRLIVDTTTAATATGRAADRARGPATEPPPTLGALALAAPPRRRDPADRRHLWLVGGHEPALPGTAAARTVAQLIAEALVGMRRPEQLRSRASLEVCRVVARARRTYRGCHRPAVQRLLLAAPAAGALEVGAVVRYGARRRALALRLDLVGDRWLCTAMQAG